MQLTSEQALPCGPSPVPTPGEEWRPVPGSEGLYSVSNLGRVRSEPIQTSRVGRQRGRILSCYRDSKGYLQFRVCLAGGRNRSIKVHRVVALAFLGPRPEGFQVNHKSGDKLDNSVGNLEYVTCKENIRHGWRLGLFRGEHARGERNHAAKLTASDVRQMRLLRSTMSLRALADRFGVTQTTVSGIVRGKSWKHVA